MLLFSTKDRQLFNQVFCFAEELARKAGAQVARLDEPAAESIVLTRVSPFDTDSAMPEVLMTAVQEYAQLAWRLLEIER